MRRKKFAGETGLAQGEVIALIALPAIAWRQLPWTGNAAQLPTHQGPLRFDRAPFIAKCHSIGLRVDYWVIDDATEAALVAYRALLSEIGRARRCAAPR